MSANINNVVFDVQKKGVEHIDTIINKKKLFGMALEKVGTTERIIKDENVLSSDFIPPSLPGREKEIDFLMQNIAKCFFEKQFPSNIFVYGGPGAGKTSIVRFAFEGAEEYQKEMNLKKAVFVYVNCKKSNMTENQVLLSILNDEKIKEIGEKYHIYGEKINKKPNKQLYDFISNVIRKGNINIFVCLDEIDKLKRKSEIDSIFYNFHRLNSGRNSKTNIYYVSITSNINLKDFFDKPTKSSLQKEDLVLSPYTPSQIERILEDRVERGFKENTVDKGVLGYIAAYTKKTYDGDVRVAIYLLKLAAENAENKNKKNIDLNDVRQAIDKLSYKLIEEYLELISRPCLFVLLSTALLIEHTKNKYNKEEVLSGDAYDEYCYLCKEKLGISPKTMRWFREYINDLERMGLIILSPAGKGIKGHSRSIMLSKYFSTKEVIDATKKVLNLE